MTLRPLASHVAVLALGSVLALALLVGVDRVVGWLLPEGGASVSYPPDYFAMTDYGVPVPEAGEYPVHSEDPQTGETIYDVVYRIDRYGNRVTGPEEDAPRERFVVLMGGSFTYGEGLPDDDTLAAQLARAAPRLHPYTVAFHGYGPLELLSRLTFTDLRAFVEEPRGDFVYTFIDHHLKRVAGSLRVHRWARDWQTWVEDEDGRLVHVKDRRQAWPLQSRLFDVLLHSNLLAWFGVDLPPSPLESDLRRTAQAFRQMREESQRQFPDSRFFLLFFPGSDHGMEVAERLVDTDIRNLDYHSLFDPKLPANRLHPKDVHPSARAIGLLADRLAADLSGPEPLRVGN